MIYNKRLRTEIEEESQKSNKTLLSWPYRFSMSTPGNSKVFTVSTLTKDDIMLNVIAHLNKCLQAGEVICILYLSIFEAFYVRPCIIASIYIHMYHSWMWHWNILIWVIGQWLTILLILLLHIDVKEFTLCSCGCSTYTVKENTDTKNSDNLECTFTSSMVITFFHKTTYCKQVVWTT